MKKIILFLSLFVLAACTSNNNDENEQSSQKNQQSSIDQSATSSSNPASSSKEQSESKNQDPFKSLTKKYPQQAFPQEIPYDSNKKLNISATAENQNISVLYYQSTQQLALNDKQLNAETAFASFKKEIYENDEQAKEAVEKQIASGASTVDLGYGITGYQEGAAGSVYLSWEEGNWTITIRATNFEDQDPIGKGKEMVDYLEKNRLPAPDTDGQINVDMVLSDLNSTIISWQEKETVYIVTHEDTLSGLAMAISLK